ncbi:hypothetical protein DX926_05020 [Bacillus atrophaeus]|nr:hypothetical protein DX926_05020 [Bacillus atrophaeus]
MWKITALKYKRNKKERFPLTETVLFLQTPSLALTEFLKPPASFLYTFRFLYDEQFYLLLYEERLRAFRYGKTRFFRDEAAFMNKS